MRGMPGRGDAKRLVSSCLTIARLAAVSPSMGLMLETTNTALLAPGAAHDNAPDKVPATRLRTIRLPPETLAKGYADLAPDLTVCLDSGRCVTPADLPRRLIAAR